ncbi:MAG: DnaJ domain-containing protein [Myxococcota bacterium]
MANLAPTEIKALARIIGEIDYYQLLHLRRDAASGEVKKAYHATSRAFHPDANRHLDPDLQEAVRVVAMRVSEAYSVLRNPRRRKAYDQRLDAGDGVRIQLAEAQAAAQKKEVEQRSGRTAQGRQFYQLAQKDMKRSDWSAALRNLQTALTFESDNELFKEELSMVRKKLGYAK